MTEKTIVQVNNEIEGHLDRAYAALVAATLLADRHGATFEFPTPVLGIGGRYVGGSLARKEASTQ